MIDLNTRCDYRSWAPRPDQPDRYDEQTAFYNSKLPGVAFCVGGNGAGCCFRDQPIYDPVRGVATPISQIKGPFHVWAMDASGAAVIAAAWQPKVYGTAHLYRISLSSGRTISVTLGHRVQTDQGWREVGDILRDPHRTRVVSEPAESRFQVLVPSERSFRHGIQVAMQSVSVTDRPDVTDDAECRDARPVLVSVGTPSSGELQSQSRDSSCPELWSKYAENSSRTLPSSMDRCSPCRCPCGEQLPSLSGIAQETFQQQADAHEPHHVSQPSGDLVDKPVSSDVYITSVEYIGFDEYWDFHVPIYENYWMEGIWHHNTTETATAKVCKFVLADQPPPRRDTPFYIIASSYEQAMKVIWKDKMLGHGHMPRSEVDWERVAWYSSKDNWPYRVPLKPWPGRPGRNWVLEFKSYEQGQAQFMADSIGGFLFSEQFPWGLLEEVLRGCREYNFHGAKLCEFTPVDPMMSAPLEDMIDNDKLPPGWAVFRANTECAMEAGHVSEEWYHEFFGMVSDEMSDVRKIGAFGSYKGRVYPTFSKIHLTDAPLEELLPSGMFHRRGLDFGFGEDNAFSCVFGARSGAGHWIIYDEYYSTNQQYTIHDHLKAIADMHEWPRNNTHYGTTWADPSEPGNIRLAAKFSQVEPDYENFSIQAASNRVLEGIEHVRWLLKPDANHKPRLIIHRGNCPKLTLQMKTYRFLQGAEHGRNPRDAKPQVLKKDDHAVDALRYLVFSEANSMGITPEGVRREKNYNRYGIKFNGDE